MSKAKTIWVIVLAVLLTLSIVFNITLLFSLAYLDSESVYEYNEMNTEWCGYSNTLIDYSNSLVDELQYYLEGYEDVEKLNQSNCRE